MEESIRILYQCGFEENKTATATVANDEEGSLFYRKNDFGLLYLTKSLLESIEKILISTS
jgi:hypothetical protein